MPANWFQRLAGPRRKELCRGGVAHRLEPGYSISSISNCNFASALSLMDVIGGTPDSRWLGCVRNETWEAIEDVIEE